MRKVKILSLVLITYLIFVINSFGADKATIAVLPFIVDDSVRINVNGLQVTREVINNEFTNQVNDFLVKSRKFTVLDRNNIRKIIEENRLTESDWAKPGEEKRIGKLLVSDYLVIGHIPRLEFLLKPINIKISGEKTFKIVATMKIQVRVTKVSSGQVVCANTFIQRLTSRQVRDEVPIDIRRDWTLSDYKDYLFKKAVRRIGNYILAGVYPVKIASVDKKAVVLNRGQGAGINTGDQLEVFNVGKAVVDPDTGEKLGDSEEKVGVIEVTEVLPKFSKGKILSSTATISVGAICRLINVEEEKAAPAYPRTSPGW